MGLFSKKLPEKAFCEFCSKEIKGLHILSTKTASGKYICSKCMSKLHLDDIFYDIDKMSDDEIGLFLDTMRENDNKCQAFTAKQQFPGYGLEVDPTHQWVKFSNHHYIFATDEMVAIVYSIVVNKGTAEGELLFHTLNPYYSFHKVTVKARLSGFLRSAQEKSLVMTLNSISAALGDVPLFTPKEYKRSYKRVLAEKEAEILEDIEALDLENIVVEDNTSNDK